MQSEQNSKYNYSSFIKMDANQITKWRDDNSLSALVHQLYMGWVINPAIRRRYGIFILNNEDGRIYKLVNVCKIVNNGKFESMINVEYSKQALIGDLIFAEVWWDDLTIEQEINIRKYQWYP